MNYCQSQRSRRWLSVFSIVLRRVHLSIIYVGQWRRMCAVYSISELQLQNGFKESWKICLNLCSRKWLKPSSSLVINLIPLGLWQLKRLLADGLIIFRILFLKVLKLLKFLGIETAKVSYVMMKFIPFYNSWREERVF